MNIFCICVEKSWIQDSKFQINFESTNIIWKCRIVESKKLAWCLGMVIQGPRKKLVHLNDVEKRNSETEPSAQPEHPTQTFYIEICEIFLNLQTLFSNSWTFFHIQELFSTYKWIIKAHNYFKFINILFQNWWTFFKSANAWAGPKGMRRKRCRRPVGQGLSVLFSIL